MREGSNELYRHTEVVAGILETQTERKFIEAVSCLDGVVPADVAVEYVDYLRRQHRREMDELEARLSRLEGIDYAIDRYRRLSEQLGRTIHAQTQAASDLVGAMGDIEQKLKEMENL